MEYKGITKTFVNLFEKLMAKEEVSQQREVAQDIVAFCQDIEEDIEQLPWGDPIQEVHSACLTMTYWKDATGRCKVTDDDIQDFHDQLRKALQQSNS